jgi:hypothetical protein
LGARSFIYIKSFCTLGIVDIKQLINSEYEKEQVIMDVCCAMLAGYEYYDVLVKQLAP